MTKEIQEVFDFSDEYQKEEIDLGMFNGHPFSVTVQELSNAVYVQLQKEFLGTFKIPTEKNTFESQAANRDIDPSAFNDKRNLAAVASWTLKHKDGRPIDVCLAAWKALPRRMTELVEKGIERLNPDLDKDFRSDSTGTQD